MNLGKTIRDIRNKNEMTQEDFAELFHITRQTVSSWENEKSYPDLITLIEISDKFDISLDTMLKGDRKMTEKLNRDISWGKRLKTVLPIAIGVIIICAGLFFWLYWGIVPVESSEVEITTNATYIENYVVDGVSQGPEYRVDFHWKLKSGKCLDVRDYKEGSEEFQGENVVVPYDSYKMPFDDRGEHPNEFKLGFSREVPFTENETLIVKFKDKTVEYKLKDIAEEAGIQ
ncbi:MAG: helix-turn-helix transcriptional regulator [Mogibacterium sp.]|nr:helix-turn-helix transcriptional regulator [Mogibacterium sp.]